MIKEKIIIIQKRNFFKIYEEFIYKRDTRILENFEFIHAKLIEEKSPNIYYTIYEYKYKEWFILKRILSKNWYNKILCFRVISNICPERIQFIAKSIEDDIFETKGNIEFIKENEHEIRCILSIHQVEFRSYLVPNFVKSHIQNKIIEELERLISLFN
jgi:hypothetical protein